MEETNSSAQNTTTEQSAIEDRYSMFMANKSTDPNYVDSGVQLLAEIRAAGINLVKKSERAEYSQFARDIADRIFEVTGEYYSIRLDLPDKALLDNVVETRDQRVQEDQNISDNPIFGVICANHHISYFDKRKICRDDVNVIRRIVRELGNQANDKRSYELLLTCEEPGCSKKIKVRVDCEGYK